jgi:His-Xaa-Ser system protein HxsD
MKINNEFQLDVDKSIYSLQAIKNASYDYSDKAWIKIDTMSNSRILVSLIAKNENISKETFINEFLNHVLDHQVRLDVSKETRVICEMIVAQAFEPCDNLDEIVTILTND